MEEYVRRFRIDVDAIEKLGRSFDSLAEARMCATARARLGEETESQVPSVDPSTKKVVFETRKTKISPFDLIREHCIHERDFMHPSLSILEVLFRLFLSNGNQPLTLEEIRSRLDEWPLHAERLRQLDDEALTSLMIRDSYYCFRPIEVPAAGD
jgi:hypothetical protein